MEALTDAVGLRAPGLRLAVVDVLNGQVEFVLMVLPGSSVLGSTVSEDAQQLQLVLLIKRKHPVIEHVGHSNEFFLS